MQRFQVQVATVLVMIVGASALDGNGGFYGRSIRPGSAGGATGNNWMVRQPPNDRERYNVISKDVKREVDAGDDLGGCCGGDDIPLELALQLGNITAAEDIFNLIDPDSIDPRILSNKDFGERSIGTKPVPAGCNTMDTIVPLRPADNTDPRLIYSPQCTRVKRCSGCCVSSRLACHPTSTRTIPFEVTVLEYTSGTKIRFKNREPVLIEEHLSCSCQCRVKEEHCNSLQRYNAQNCRCDCTNPDDRAKCLAERDIKQWNPDKCLCECNEYKDCPSGTYFDHNYCRCLKTDFYSIH